MKNKVFFVFLFSLFTISIFAQNDHRSTGLIFDDEAYNQVPHLPKYEGKKYNEIPVKVSLKEYCPTPGDQGTNGSCVGWATGYAGLTITHAILDSITDKEMINSMAHSALYIYNQIKLESDDCGAGSKITDALTLLREKGDCFANSFDSELENCDRQPDKDLHEEAEPHKIKDYAAVFNFADEANTKIDQTRKSLIDKKPVIIGMNITPSFWNIEPGQQIWEFEEGEAILGGHAMVVVGFDEILKSFELMNSWGTRFGDEGFIWVSYEDYAQHTKYGFQIIPNDNKTVQEEVTKVDPEIKEEECIIELAGDFVFRYPNGYKKDENGNQMINFVEATSSFSADKNCYNLTGKNWKVGDIFQLVARNVPAGKSVYVFSIDPENKLELHWPKENTKIFDPEKDAFSTIPLATYMPSENAEVIIPGVENALQLSAPGDDFLCVLYSNEKIENIDSRLLKVKNSSGDFMSRLRNGFEDILADENQITYARRQMTFDCSAEKGDGVVVPIILSVTAE